MSEEQREKPVHEGTIPARLGFEMDTPEGRVRRELPFVVGVLADLSGQGEGSSSALMDRKFVEINKDNFETVVTSLAPRLLLEVPNRLGAGEPFLRVDLRFYRLSDFEPWSIARRVPLLCAQLGAGGASPEVLSVPAQGLSGSSLLLQVLERTESGNQQQATGGMSAQLDEIIHAPEFQKLEATWRALWYLILKAEGCQDIKIRVLDISKKQLLRDFQKAVSFDQTIVFKRLHDDEYGVIGGWPYGALIGDYEFINHPEDMKILEQMAVIAATINAPFIAGAGAGLFGCDDFAQLAELGTLPKIFEGLEYARWRSFRASGASRFVGLVLPRVCYRTPYGPSEAAAHDFVYSEDIGSGDLRYVLWGSAAYVFAARLLEAHKRYGICTAICGREGGGLVAEFPTASSHAGFPESRQRTAPTEIALSEARSRELSSLGFLALAHPPEAGWAAFLETPSCHKPPVYAKPEVTKDARLAADLRCILAISRFAQYVKVITLEKAHRPGLLTDCAQYLNGWLGQFVSAKSEVDAGAGGSAPLRHASVEIQRVPGLSGRSQMVLLLQPNLGVEKLSSPVRLVIEVPGLRR